MKRFKNHLILAAVLAGLAVAGVMMNSHPVSATGAAPVSIVSPVPIPVTGSTIVSGTVAATQSGPWNVGITGTPTVSIANPASSPLSLRDLDNPGRHRFQIDFGCPMFDGDFTCATSFAAPNDKLLVIETISATASPPSGEKVMATITTQQGPNNSVGFFFPLQLVWTGSAVDQFAATTAVRLYADPATNVDIGFQRNIATGATGDGFRLSGYLVDCGSAGTGCPLPQ